MKSTYAQGLDSLIEFAANKFPAEYEAREKTFSAWWSSLSARENKDDPESYRTPEYPAMVAAFDALLNLLEQDREWLDLRSRLRAKEKL